MRQVTYPWQMQDEEVLLMFFQRFADNLRETKHPLHHKTANGAIVTPDPTLQYYMQRLKQSKDEYYRKAIETALKDVEQYESGHPDIPSTIPVNRKYYGHDPYERH